MGAAAYVENEQGRATAVLLQPGLLRQPVQQHRCQKFAAHAVEVVRVVGNIDTIHYCVALGSITEVVGEVHSLRSLTSCLGSDRKGILGLGDGTVHRTGRGPVLWRLVQSGGLAAWFNVGSASGLLELQLDHGEPRPEQLCRRPWLRGRREHAVRISPTRRNPPRRTSPYRPAPQVERLRDVPAEQQRGGAEEAPQGFPTRGLRFSDCLADFAIKRGCT